MEPSPHNPDDGKLRIIIASVYILQAISFFVGVTLIIGAIVSYVKKSDCRGTWMESHIKWQIQTFWWVLGLTILGGILFAFGIGYIILAGTAIWFIYRIIKGGMYVYENRPLPKPGESA